LKNQDLCRLLNIWKPCTLCTAGSGSDCPFVSDSGAFIYIHHFCAPNWSHCLVISWKFCACVLAGSFFITWWRSERVCSSFCLRYNGETCIWDGCNVLGKGIIFAFAYQTMHMHGFSLETKTVTSSWNDKYIICKIEDCQYSMKYISSQVVYLCTECFN
jgi:hypothetical protein